MTNCYLVRHADAGARGIQNDHQRRLSKRGRAQAERLAAQLAPSGATEIRSSPFARCMETLSQLADVLSLPVEPDLHLGEGSGPTHALSLIEHTEAPLVLCSHGDVIGDVMHAIARRGVELDDDRLAKASTWIITVDAGAITAARYVPPPTCP